MLYLCLSCTTLQHVKYKYTGFSINFQNVQFNKHIIIVKQLICVGFQLYTNIIKYHILVVNSQYFLFNYVISCIKLKSRLSIQFKPSYCIKL